MSQFLIKKDSFLKTYFKNKLLLKTYFNYFKLSSFVFYWLKKLYKYKKLSVLKMIENETLQIKVVCEKYLKM